MKEQPNSPEKSNPPGKGAYTKVKLPVLTESQKEMYKLCTKVLDLEAEWDDDNADILLREALDTVKQIRGLIK